MRRAAAAAGVALLAVIACSGRGALGPRPQWVVYVATDAPVPAFGEQLAVEVVDDGGNLVSPDARRLFDASQPAAWPLSFGVLPATAGGSAPRIHVQLYRLDQSGPGSSPTGGAYLDATARLPSSEGVTKVALVLPMACFSVLSDLPGQRTCDPSSGALAPEPTLAPDADPSSLPSPGSWPPARRVPCRGTVPPGMVCIPGGAFLMGSLTFPPYTPDLVPVPERLVQLSPFALDVDEMTVGQVRALVTGMGLTPPVQGDFTHFDNGSNGPCTYAGPTDPSHDAYPINCLDWPTAVAACRLLGKRLPREAEWEYAAGNLDLKTHYPWGSDPDICHHSIVARGSPNDPSASTDCLVAPDGTLLSPGVVAGGSAGDVTQLGVRNLGGNLTEYLQDLSQPYDSPCWSGSTLLVDPVCTTGAAGNYSVRGGNWEYPAFLSETYLRDSADPMSQFTTITGVRCALGM